MSTKTKRTLLLTKGAVRIDCPAVMVETTGMSETIKPERRFQFSLRKLLLWMAVVALCLGISSACGQNPILWLLLTCWCAAIGGLRWNFGRIPAACASIIGAGILMSVVYAVTETLLPIDYAGATFAGLVIGMPIGIVLFAMLELVSLLVNWLDRVFIRKEETRVSWLILGLLCGIALAVMKPQINTTEGSRGYYRVIMLQRTASDLYWYSLIGVAIGAVCDLLQNPPRVRSFRIGLRGLLLVVLSVGSFPLGWFLYLRIITLSYP